MKNIVGLSYGNPYSARTYSAVPYCLFNQLDSTGKLLTRIDSINFRLIDLLSNRILLLKSLKERRRFHNPFWRYYQSNIESLTARINKRVENLPKKHTTIAFGVSAIPKTENNFLIAHVEISVKAATELKEYNKTYGFQNPPKTVLSRAIAGEKYFLEKCDLIWTNSEWTAKTFEHHGILSKKFIIQAPGCNTKDPGPIEREWSCPKILFMGKDWIRKGGPQLVQAFYSLLSKHPNATLDIIGCTPKINHSKIKIHGFLNRSNKEEEKKINKIYKSCNLFCMPSAWESTGIVYMEAMLYGLPTIMVNGQGRSKIFPDETCTKLESNSPESILQSILTLFDSENLAKSIGNKGRQHILKNYTWDIIAQRIASKSPFHNT